MALFKLGGKLKKKTINWTLILQFHLPHQPIQQTENLQAGFPAFCIPQQLQCH